MADPVFAMVAMVALVALIEMYLKSKREFEGPLVCKLHSFGKKKVKRFSWNLSTTFSDSFGAFSIVVSRITCIT